MGGAVLAGTPPRVRTEADAWDGNPGWQASPDSHVLAPLDAGFDEQGACVYIPHCPSRLLAALETRSTLEAGEAVTVVVSVLRGAAEAHALGARTGGWWVTAEGRPVVATTGDAPWQEEAVEILKRVAGLSTVLAPDLLARATTAIIDPRRLRRDIPSLENSLFAAAEPLALTAPPSRPRLRATTPLPVDVDGGAREGFVIDLVRRYVDGMWGERIADAWSSLRERGSRMMSGGRRGSGRAAPTTDRRRLPRPVMLGCAAAAIVLTVGLSWPDEHHDDAAAAREQPATGAPSPSAVAVAPSATPRPTPPPRSPSGDDALMIAARKVLDDLARCLPSGCGEDVVEQPGRSFPRGPATRADTERRVEIVDDYGGVAAVRVTSNRRTQIAVIVVSEEKWLVRDIYDVADQPD